MELAEITRTVDKMRTAVDRKLRLRRIWSRLIIGALLAACGALAFPLVLESERLAHLRTFTHNSKVHDDERNQFVGDIATYVHADDLDRLVVDGWGRITSYDAGADQELLVIKFHYSVVAPAGAKVALVGRWSQPAPVAWVEEADWTSGPLLTAQGRSRVVVEEPGRSAIAATGCSSTKNAAGGAVRHCAGSVVFEVLGDGPDRVVVPDDILIARTNDDGSRTGLARSVLVDDARRWQPCQLVVCTGPTLEPVAAEVS